MKEGGHRGRGEGKGGRDVSVEDTKEIFHFQFPRHNHTSGLNNYIAYCNC